MEKILRPATSLFHFLTPRLTLFTAYFSLQMSPSTSKSTSQGSARPESAIVPGSATGRHYGSNDRYSPANATKHQTSQNAISPSHSNFDHAHISPEEQYFQYFVRLRYFLTEEAKMSERECDPLITTFTRANYLANGAQIPEPETSMRRTGSAQDIVTESQAISVETQMQKRAALYRVFCKLLMEKKNELQPSEYEDLFERGVMFGQKFLTSNFGVNGLTQPMVMDQSVNLDGTTPAPSKWPQISTTSAPIYQHYQSAAAAIAPQSSGKLYFEDDLASSLSAIDEDDTRTLLWDDDYEQYVEENIQIQKSLQQRVFETISKVLCFVFPGILQVGLYFNKEWYKTLMGDLIGGISVAAISIPQCVSYGLLAGLPPVYGLYTSLIPMFVYCFFGTSRHISIAPIAVIALLNATAIGDLETVEEKVMRSLLISFQAGLIMIIMGVCRFGFLVNFLSQPVLTGFISAVGLMVMVSQIRDLLGVKVPNAEGLHEHIWYIIKALPSTKWQSVVLGVVCIIILYIAKNIAIPITWKGKKTKITLKKVPMNLIMVILSISGMFAVYKLRKPTIVESEPQMYGIRLVGSMPSGFPAPSLEVFQGTWDNFWATFAFSIPMAILGYVQTFSVMKYFSDRHNYAIDANQELIAGGAAAVAGAFFGSFYPSGAASRSMVGEDSGVRTQMHGLVVFAAITVTVLFLTPLFYFLPKPLLAAIIIIAVYQLVNVSAFFRCLKVKPVDALSMAIAFLATLFVGLDTGVFIAAAVSLMLIVFRASRARVPLMGRVPGTALFRAIKRCPEAIPYKGIITLRFEADVLFVNVNHLRYKVFQRIDQSKWKVQVLVLDLSTVATIDTTGITGLLELFATIESRGIHMLFAGVKEHVWRICKRDKMDKKIPADRFFAQTDLAIYAAQKYITQKAVDARSLTSAAVNKNHVQVIGDDSKCLQVVIDDSRLSVNAPSMTHDDDQSGGENDVLEVNGLRLE